MDKKLLEKVDRIVTLSLLAREQELQLRSCEPYRQYEATTLELSQLRAGLNGERKPAKPAAKRSANNGLQSNIAAYLAAHPGERFRANDIAKALNRKARNIRMALFFLAKKRAVTKVARGVYAAKAA